MIRAWLVNIALFAACVAGILFSICFGAWLLIVAGAVYVTVGMIGLAVWIGLALTDARPPKSAPRD
ncbi:hypothetical protein [Rhodoblastus sp.]|uniref:hypothetical protein n=1 Tax=Rhodoblastus sp. TaxID=1962975 RepID=UPI00260962BB|nr:hypothetical protein [Rhodoblastus sp.]